MSGTAPDLPLSPYRVLDLTDEHGLLCGRVLGDLGADVVQVEPPGGSRARRLGPFVHGKLDPEGSLHWWFYCANKRGITLDLASADGRALFLRLAERSHFLIESFEPGYLDSQGLGWDALRRANPALVLVSITAFGQKGPRSHWRATDLTGMASSGLLYVTGDPDRPPVRVGFPQFYLHGSAAAAAGAMVAHYVRRRTGRGEHVDVSCQDATVRALSSAVPTYVIEKAVITRQGALRQTGKNSYMRLMWRCKDGHVNFQLAGGQVSGRSTLSLIAWMEEDRMGDPYLREVPWDTLGYGLLTREVNDRVCAIMERWFLTKTKAELYRGALDRRILMFPVSAPTDIPREDQLDARGYWERLERDGEKVMFPGTFAWTSEWGRLRIRRAAPRIGEHNRDVYTGELGLSHADLSALRGAGVV